jgi:tryptophan synthase alpha chain
VSKLESNRLVSIMQALRKQGRKTLLPFITAGYPDLETTSQLLAEFEKRGAKVCELGIPFSDPVADGPVIQASYTRALEKGLKVKQIFEMVSDYRRNGGQMALIAMVTFSIVYRHGVRNFLKEASQAGIDGLILPDFSLEEADNLVELCQENNLANVMLIAPTTPEQRKLRIASYSRGFIYYISVAGITGERAQLPPSTIQAVKQLREHTETPVCVGFGISNADLVRTVCEAADGAIVGSAIVHRITDLLDRPMAERVEKVGDFVQELLSGTQDVSTADQD